jgi:hypothetical protein
LDILKSLEWGGEEKLFIWKETTQTVNHCTLWTPWRIQRNPAPFSDIFQGNSVGHGPSEDAISSHNWKSGAYMRIHSSGQMLLLVSD